MTSRRSLSRSFGLIAGFALVAGASAVRSDLSQETSITEGLIAVGIAYEIGEQCSSINARVLMGISYLNQLKSEAQSLGYYDADINAYVDNDAEQDRLEAIARGRLADLGAVSGQAETYCTVGLAQIEQQTVAGQLLR